MTRIVLAIFAVLPCAVVSLLTLGFVLFAVLFTVYVAGMWWELINSR